MNELARSYFFPDETKRQTTETSVFSSDYKTDKYLILSFMYDCHAFVMRCRFYHMCMVHLKRETNKPGEVSQHEAFLYATFWKMSNIYCKCTSSIMLEMLVTKNIINMSCSISKQAAQKAASNFWLPQLEETGPLTTATTENKSSELLHITR